MKSVGYKMDGYLIDTLMLLCSLGYNIVGVLIFVLRAQKQKQLEFKLGPVFNAFLIPFSLILIFNLIYARDFGLLITGIPIIIFLVYDLWYRTITDKKPYHHPKRWPMSLYIYLLLYQLSSIMLNGYSFQVSLIYGYIVLASYFSSLIAYGYYQRKRNQEIN